MVARISAKVSDFVYTYSRIQCRRSIQTVDAVQQLQQFKLSPVKGSWQCFLAVKVTV